MDAVSYAHSAKQAKRIKRFIENPDSNSGVLTQPKVIEAGETVTIKSGRQAILADTVVDGDLVIEAGGEVFVPAGAGFGDLESQIALKADTSYVDGKYSGFKNYIINGGFDIWQRGTSFTGANGYTADRWKVRAPNSGTVDVFIAGTSSTEIKSGKGISVSRFDNSCWIGQHIEGKSNAFSNKTFTISAIFYNNGEATTLKANFGGTEFNYFDDVILPANSLVKYSSSKLTGTIPDNPLLFFGQGNSTAAHEIRIYNVQLEEGSIATPFEQRPYGLELSLCQRYYNIIGFKSGGLTDASGQKVATFYTPVSMRTAPTYTVYDIAGNIGKISTFTLSGVRTDNSVLAFIGTFTPDNLSSFCITLSSSTTSGISGRAILDAEL